nr:MAG: hypothetical protein DIU78_20870 [Pseudomonadota bacterium]
MSARISPAYLELLDRLARPSEPEPADPPRRAALPRRSPILAEGCTCPRDEPDGSCPVCQEWGRRLGPEIP